MPRCCDGSAHRPPPPDRCLRRGQRQSVDSDALLRTMRGAISHNAAAQGPSEAVRKAKEALYARRRQREAEEAARRQQCVLHGRLCPRPGLSVAHVVKVVKDSSVGNKVKSRNILDCGNT